MPKVESLMGLGTPAALAAGLGNSKQAVTCAAATTASGAGAIAPGLHVVLLTAATSTANSAVFSTAQSVGTPIYVTNSISSSVTASVYTPNVTGALMNGTTNGSILLTTGQSAIFIQTTANEWVSVKSA